MLLVKQIVVSYSVFTFDLTPHPYPVAGVPEDVPDQHQKSATFKDFLFLRFKLRVSQYSFLPKAIEFHQLRIDIVLIVLGDSIRTGSNRSGSGARRGCVKCLRD